ncbi:DNA-directed RNA polymerase subunit beta [Patescibacteria group bacterium]|nr:DNA-directed RNA polymerase subunit beta [Patescibacteria group bacterium]MBU1673326.1 DNA-directed RNA polymerase subunit beta [Patescibacteria group bacterium]MBU1963555.1 DNA-directed RNA polymerase subunit beta [Patescibacteria group bacterium]
MRKTFSKIKDAMPLPNLIEVQQSSYKWFLGGGLKELLEEISPIEDFTGRDLELYLGDYYLDEPRFDEKTVKDKNLTFEAAIRVNAKLKNKRTNEVKEQEVYFGDLPLMTERGTFIVNGIERVVVSQLIRSAGVFFTSELIKGRNCYGAKIIPNRGAWLEFETDGNDVIYVKIDRKRKVPASALLRAFGMSSDEEILEAFKDTDNDPEHNFMEATIKKDVSKSEGEGLKEVYKRIRPGDLATVDNARGLIHSMFFNFSRYDFGRVGRYKINARFGFDAPINRETRVLHINDILAVLKEIIRLNNSQEEADDIDHLGNRRVRAVGELVQNKFRIGLARMERIVKDRMSTKDISTLTPGQLINARPIIGSIREFFMSSQLSQFMDQTNPLAELEHKRRLSAMGPGGLSRERAGFEVRDVHRTHYGRICPIATPEGPNIGLVGHLATYARINEFGFIETPYLKIEKDSDNKKAKVSGEIEWLDAFTEEKITTTAATTEVDEEGFIVDEKVEARVKTRATMEYAWNVDYMDVAPRQIVSVATALIPFLEHDDAVRALMGTNMQRQAVSLVKPESPVIGTGIETRAAVDSGQAVTAKHDGEIVGVQANKIEVKDKNGAVQTYSLGNFVRSNALTCMNHKPVVSKGDKIKKGDVLADGASTDGGELALGQNALVAYMPWEGGNYEDAILISDRLVQSDKYSSIHIEDYSVDIRETKLGPELVTRDIPNVSEEKLKDLDSEGVVRVGAQVSSGDILVGKITPKGETELSAEEKLLRAIFGEKAKDVKDSSLYLEHGEHGKVVDVKIFSKENGDKLASGVIKTIQVSIAQLRKLQVGDKMAGRHGNKGVISRIVPVEDMPFMKDGTPVDIILNPLGIVSRMNLGQVLEVHLGLAAKALGYKVAVPPFHGASKEQISEELKKAGFPDQGKLTLIDGRTGDEFKQNVTCGIAYMLKLNHMVEDKIHQRSIGPYSLVTQQPLGGKAQFGGQRFGEMEVWALEAYGAAHTLQEILTIKSDDVPGRSKAYESVIKNESIKKVNVPESFNVLVRELKGLGLDVNLLKAEKADSEAMDDKDESASDKSPADKKEDKEEKVETKEKEEKD